MRILLILSSLIASIVAATARPPLQIVSTTTMLSDLARQIGGSRVEVQGLMGPGVDPHLYKPTASDTARLQRADLIFYHGLHLEGQMGEVLTRLTQRGRKVFAVAESVPKNRLIQTDEAGAPHDPHIWGDASLWAECIPCVEKALTEADPAGAAHYRERAEKHQEELRALHEWAVKLSNQLPAERRVLTTSHDAFAYLGRAYGFQVVGVQGISTVSEAGLADIVKVVDFIKAKGVRAIFVESSVPRAAIERISKDSGAKIGGELFSDALGTPGKMHTLGGETYDEGTVIGMLKHNLLTIIGAL